MVLISLATAELHLLEYHKHRYAYLKAYRARSSRTSLIAPPPLRNFSKPLTIGVAKHVGGYDNRSISDDLIADVYSKWAERTRKDESEENMRTKTGESS